VLGQAAAITTLRRGLREKRLHHALLFVGPPGVGKETTALALGCAVTCTSPSVDDGCGVCQACHRVLTRSTESPQVPLHPDVILVQKGLYPREVLGRSTEEKLDISVDQIRRVVLERVSFPPHEARERLIIVRDAHDLGVSAANALLKTLEEPPHHTRFVLLTDRPGELLPTIRSRTLLVRFAALTDEIVESLLVRTKGLPPERARALAHLAEGSMARAASLADEQKENVRAEAISALRAAAGDRVALFDASAEYANSTESRGELDTHLAALLAEEAREVRDLVLRGGNNASIEAAIARWDAAVRLREALTHNANVPLALEAEWLRLGGRGRDPRRERGQP